MGQDLPVVRKRQLSMMSSALVIAAASMAAASPAFAQQAPPAQNPPQNILQAQANAQQFAAPANTKDETTPPALIDCVITMESVPANAP